MTRLTNTLKDEIIANAIKKAGIPERNEVLASRRAAWLNEVRLNAIGGSAGEKKLIALEKRIKKSLKDLPKDIANSKNPLNHQCYVYVNIAGQQRRFHLNGANDGSTLNLSWDSAWFISPRNLTVEIDDPLVETMEILTTEQNKLIEECGDIKANVRGALSSVTTVKSLLKAWPEAKELLPKDIEKAMVKLPAVKTENLNKMIGLPTQEIKAA